MWVVHSYVIFPLWLWRWIGLLNLKCVVLMWTLFLIMTFLCEWYMVKLLVMIGDQKDIKRIFNSPPPYEIHWCNKSCGRFARFYMHDWLRVTCMMVVFWSPTMLLSQLQCEAWNDHLCDSQLWSLKWPFVCFTIVRQFQCDPQHDHVLSRVHVVALVGKEACHSWCASLGSQLFLSFFLHVTFQWCTNFHTTLDAEDIWAHHHQHLFWLVNCM